MRAIAARSPPGGEPPGPARDLRLRFPGFAGDLCVVPEPAVELGPQTEFDPDL